MAPNDCLLTVRELDERLGAFVGGGAGGATAGFTTMGIDPEHFNLLGDLRKIFFIAGTTFLMNGVIAVFAYRKQSPLPKKAFVPGA